MVTLDNVMKAARASMLVAIPNCRLWPKRMGRPVGSMAKKSLVRSFFCRMAKFSGAENFGGAAEMLGQMVQILAVRPKYVS